MLGHLGLSRPRVAGTGTVRHGLLVHLSARKVSRSRRRGRHGRMAGVGGGGPLLLAAVPHLPIKTNARHPLFLHART